MIMDLKSALILTIVISWAILGTLSLDVSVDGCGETKQCFLRPDGCSNEDDCDFLVTWAENGDNIDFEVSVRNEGPDYIYASIGVSKSDSMVDTSVTDCIMISNAGSVSMSYNIPEAYNNIELPNDPNLGLSGESSVSLENGRIICRFSRIKSVADGPRPDVDYVFDLTDQYYLLVATGYLDINTGLKLYHGPNHKLTSQELLSFVGVPRRTSKRVSRDVSVDGCGETKQCFRRPEGCSSEDDCDFLVTWAENGDNIDFEVSVRNEAADNVWTAIGMSKSDSMADSSITDCIMYNNGGRVSMSYNVPEAYNNIVLPNHPSLGLSGQSSVSLENGRIICRFSRIKTVTDGPQPDVDYVFDLTEQYYLLVATGNMNVTTGLKAYHGFGNKLTSQELLSFVGVPIMAPKSIISPKMNPILLGEG